MTRATTGVVAWRLLAVGTLAVALGVVPISASPARAGTDDAGRPSPSLSTPAERAERAAGLELLAVVPGEYDQRCLIQTDSDLTVDPGLVPFEPRIDAALRCQTDDGVTLYAFKVADAATVDEMFDAAAAAEPDPNVAACTSDGTWGDGRGRLKCYRVGTAATMLWTAPDVEMLFAAYRVDGDLARLSEWWESSSPPISEPPPPDEVVSDRAWRDNAKTLLRSVPKRLRRSCDVPSISEAELGPLFRDRLVLRTVLHCDPRSDTRLTVLDFRYTENAPAYVNAHLPVSQPVEVTFRGVRCPGNGSLSFRFSKNDDVGQSDMILFDPYACFVDGAGHGTIVWSDDQEGIALRAVRTDRDLDALLRFFVNAGPGSDPNDGVG